MTDYKTALGFAMTKHANQKRRYTGHPYVTHCVEVANTMRATMSIAPGDLGCVLADDVIAMALLHDTLEDTNTSYEELVEAFGQDVAWGVLMLTDTPKSMGNRATRKAMDRARLAGASTVVQSIKVADLISNTSSIVRFDPQFAKVYLAEKRALLDALTKASPRLLGIARGVVS